MDSVSSFPPDKLARACTLHHCQCARCVPRNKMASMTGTLVTLPTCSLRVNSSAGQQQRCNVSVRTRGLQSRDWVRITHAIHCVKASHPPSSRLSRAPPTSPGLRMSATLASASGAGNAWVGSCDSCGGAPSSEGVGVEAQRDGAGNRGASRRSCRACQCRGEGEGQERASDQRYHLRRLLPTGVARPLRPARARRSRHRRC